MWLRELENTFASQRDLADRVDPHGVAESPGEGPSRSIVIGDEQPPDIFVPCEKGPEVVKSVLAVYPPLALRARIEGKVYLKIWVDAGCEE